MSFECHTSRGNLFKDVIENLQEARHKAAEEVRKLKEKLDMRSSGKHLPSAVTQQAVTLL